MKHTSISIVMVTRGILSALALCSLLAAALPNQETTQDVTNTIDIAGPPGSGEFGYDVFVLPNGNLVVTDPYYDDSATEDAGAVYLYDGATAALISSLYGSHTEDRVGLYGIHILANGHYVIQSPRWDASRGAATWCSGTAGCSGTVSAANSLVGSSANDGDGIFLLELSHSAFIVVTSDWDYPALAEDAGAVTWCPAAAPCTGIVSEANSLVGDQDGDQVGIYTSILTNGNYVVRSPYWDNGAVEDAGATTWCGGTSGCTGRVTDTNSLHGSSPDDRVGYEFFEYKNTNYLIVSPFWNNGFLIADAGAVTRCSSTSPCVGAVDPDTSLVGDHAGDRLGLINPGIVVLPSGNYVVKSPEWYSGRGAATWCNASAHCSGPISASNSLVGSDAGDAVGQVVVVLNRFSDYAVGSPNWNVQRGAVTWCEGAVGCTGIIKSTNSLVGNTIGDRVGSIVPLMNGHYVTAARQWNENRGAVTWCNGTAGCTGEINSTNSLVGSNTDDFVGNNVLTLNNGNYVVRSPNWSGNLGAATWCSGSSGCVGAVSPANSLVGTTPDDRIGDSAVALSNGNFVVSSYFWDNGSIVDAGAATWCNGTAGCVGPVSAANSLVGNKSADRVGSGVLALLNDHYVVRSGTWAFSTATDAGAITWCNGTTGCRGSPSIDNSLIGNHVGDRIGNGGINSLTNGQYVVSSPEFDRGIYVNAGAVTLGLGWGGTTGLILTSNSVIGTVAGGGYDLNWDFDYVHNQLVVGRPADNSVSLLRWYEVFLPFLKR